MTRSAPIVLIHGFTQTAACWGPVDDGLRQSAAVVALDAPGHGSHAAVEADLPTGAELLVDAGGPGTYIGYSMGARFALHAALAQPDQVERLILVSGTAGIDDATERAARRQADDALADHLIGIGVPAFLDEWLARPLFAGLPPDRQHRVERETNTAAGLASSLRLAGTGTQEPLWGRLAELALPVLVVAGERDPKFVALATRLAHGIGPGTELAIVPDAGHTVHLEQPEAFVALVERWLAST